jgi:hypothetical protein
MLQLSSKSKYTATARAEELKGHSLIDEKPVIHIWSTESANTALWFVYTFEVYSYKTRVYDCSHDYYVWFYIIWWWFL